MVLHGHERSTVDVDPVVDLDEDQAFRAIDALAGLGLRPRVPVNPRDFADAAVREGWIRDRGMQVFSAKMTARVETPDRWDVTSEGTGKQLPDSTLAAPPAQRLAWLEEMLELAHRAGALGTESIRQKI